MLETIREFTHAQARSLGIDDHIRSRHLTCMVAVTEAMAPSLESDQAGTALDLLERERDNLREALDHAVASPADPVRLANGVRIMVASHEAWKMRLGTGEARAHLDRLMRQYDPLVPGSVATPEMTGAMPSAIVADARVHLAAPTGKAAARLRAAAAGLALEALPEQVGVGQRMPAVHFGTILTGDSFINAEDHRARLHREFEGKAVEMEGGAVAQVARRWGGDIPFVNVRCLSDLAGRSSHLDFRAFLPVAARYASLVAHRLAPVI